MTENKVKEIRLSKCMNQRELAERAHICQTAISDIERGVRLPWKAASEKLAIALGVTIEELFPNNLRGGKNC
ncbi:MAG: helix-turn-helix transcriptional regulator [Dehalococcoidia bacterium]|jgi:transcriptional regulator with XRE-family HTH domain